MKRLLRNLHDLTDDELAALARRRAIDPDGSWALVLLVERYHRQRYSVAHRYAGRGGAEDLAQEAAIAVVRAVDTHRPARGPVGPWIWMWLWGATLRAARRDWAWRAMASLESLDSDAFHSAGDAGTPAELVVASELGRLDREALGSSIEKLPVARRRALLGGMTGTPSAKRTAEAMLRHPSVRPVGSPAPTPPEDRRRCSSPDGAEPAGGADGALGPPDPRGDWVVQAACRGMAPETFWGREVARRRDALKACARCPVQEECLLDALSLPEGGGIRAGTGEKERRPLRPGGRRATVSPGPSETSEFCPEF